jgi:hypothetical protein
MKAGVLVALGLFAAPALAADTQEAPPKIDPQATQVLKRMSDYLGSLHTFKVDAQTIDEKVTTDSQKLQFVADTRIAVERPNKLRADRLGPVANVVFRYDGKQFTVYGNRTGYYAQVPAPATLDAAIDAARVKYGVDAPAADLYMAHSYAELMDDVKGARYIGLEPINGVFCHHLAFQGTDTDWQIWIQDGPQPLPRRYVITTKDVVAKPQFQVAFSNWQPNAPLDAQEFVFVPPPDAKQIPWVPPGKFHVAR